MSFTDFRSMEKPVNAAVQRGNLFINRLDYYIFQLREILHGDLMQRPELLKRTRVGLAESLLEEWKSIPDELQALVGNMNSWTKTTTTDEHYQKEAAYHLAEQLGDIVAEISKRQSKLGKYIEQFRTAFPK